MSKEIISISLKELDRLQIIRDSVSRQITQEQAADRTGISIRQVKHLVQRYRSEGPQGLISRRRGQRPNIHESRPLGYEKYVDGPEPIPLDDKKSVHERVDNARFDLRSKYYVKPAADHPWNTRRTQRKDDVKPPTLPRKKAGPDTPPK